MTTSATRRNALRRLIETPPAQPPGPQPGERCELCATDIGEHHGHVVDLHERSLMCCCRPCTLLFTTAGAAAGRYRAVGDRVLRDRDQGLTDGQWDQLQLPVGMAFFFRSSATGEVSAFYPSPAGATESELSLDAWADGLGGGRLAQVIEDDIEALLVRRSASGELDCYLVPIDACYELVGLVRRSWKGFDGGSEAWETIDGFFAKLLIKSRPL
jgi:hypothetical protein